MVKSPFAEKVPRKANAFETARDENSQLLPLFPYMGPGAIVPTCAALRSDGVHSPGYFIHQNSVDEVALAIGSAGRLRTGDVFVGPRSHGVGGKSDEPFVTVMVITQRQLEGGEQPEKLTFICEQCNAELHSHEFDAKVVGEGVFAGLPTIVGSEDAAAGYNADPETRVCKQCGHTSAPFPSHIWGWGRYKFNSGIAEDAWNALAEATAR